MIKFLSLFLVSFCISAYAQKKSTIAYKQLDSTTLYLDIHQPSVAKNKFPVIFFFHGGGLVNGNKKLFQKQCDFFASKGLVAITVSYRLLPRHLKNNYKYVPDCIMDAKSAIRWVKRNAERFNIDTDRVVLSGASAGGFLAVQACLNNLLNDPNDDFSISTNAQALVLFNPAFEPIQKYYPDIMKLVTEKTPPSYLCYGDLDVKFKPGGEAFSRLLWHKNIKSELWVAPGEGHAFINNSPWTESTSILAYNFLLKIGFLKGDYETIPAKGKLLLQKL